MSSTTAVVVGLDVGGTKTNATVLAEDGRFLVDRMVEVPSRVREGPRAAVAAISEAMELALAVTGTSGRCSSRCRAGHPWASQRRGCHLGPGGDELLRT